MNDVWKILGLFLLIGFLGSLVVFCDDGEPRYKSVDLESDGSAVLTYRPALSSELGGVCCCTIDSTGDRFVLTSMDLLESNLFLRDYKFLHILNIKGVNVLSFDAHRVEVEGMGSLDILLYGHTLRVLVV